MPATTTRDGVIRPEPGSPEERELVEGGDIELLGRMPWSSNATFLVKLDHAGTTRLQGNALQDLFATAPFGWSKDATRYVFAALLVVGAAVAADDIVIAPTGLRSLSHWERAGVRGYGLSLGCHPSPGSQERSDLSQWERWPRCSIPIRYSPHHLDWH